MNRSCFFFTPRGAHSHYDLDFLLILVILYIVKCVHTSIYFVYIFVARVCICIFDYEV